MIQPEWNKNISPFYLPIFSHFPTYANLFLTNYERTISLLFGGHLSCLRHSKMTALESCEHTLGGHRIETSKCGVGFQLSKRHSQQ